MQILIHTKDDDDDDYEQQANNYLFKNSTKAIMPTFYKLNNETCML
jgi:hypothetical protein